MNGERERFVAKQEGSCEHPLHRTEEEEAVDA